MKNTLILIILFNISSGLFAQQYEPIVDQSKKWNILQTENNVAGWPWEPNVYLSTTALKIGEEVIVNGVQYYNIVGASSLADKYLREDNTNNVYIYPGINGLESLIYNFNLEIGDEIDLPDFYENNYKTWTVINVEDILIDNQSKKRIELDYLGNLEIWI